MSDPTKPAALFVEPTAETIGPFLARAVSGPITMLNLLKFRETADYSAHPALAPAEPISGRDAYRRYMDHTAPFLTDAGGELLYMGEGGDFIIGPVGAGWDLVLLVRHRSAAAFLSFASNDGYLAGVGHRTAALRDSRLLPLRDATPAVNFPPPAKHS